ncbi:Wall-associated receptor kinase, C-terminal [Parasponia andersonii]|uniref:non-specific serine/threonine protein kinase n=1 Tax=Parasponia andersonii TaxID=3476 RepID=A0A2P5AR62_PARAD|nr:Wall-associated receptor kinase, C-terminal [Parasponia andersonii]
MEGPLFFQLLIIAFSTLTRFRFSYSSDTQEFIQCSRPYKCGTLRNLSFPFWGNDRPEFCGHQSFELDCRYKQYPTSGRDNPCSPKFLNTTLDHNLFRYPETSGRSSETISIQNLTLIYGCLRPLPEFKSLPNNFSCEHGGGSGDGDVVYYADDYLMRILRPQLGMCREVVRVPVFKTALENTMGGKVELKEALNRGFEVEYYYYSSRLQGCRSCEESGGCCGFNTTTQKFLCFCRDHQEDVVCFTNNRARHKKLTIGMALLKL